MDFLLDPHILEVPEVDQGVGEIQCYLFNLQAWAGAVSMSGHRFWLSEPILFSLHKIGKYPLFDKIARLVQYLDNGDGIFDPNIAFRACEPLLTSPPYLEDEIGYTCSVPLDEKNPVIIPPSIARRLSKEIADALRETLAQVGYAKEERSHDLANNLLFATSEIDKSDDRVSVQAKVVSEDSLQITVVTDWPLITEPLALNRIEALESFWEDTERAINWAYEELCNTGLLDQDTHQLGQFVVGRKFNDSILRFNLDNKSNVLMRIFKTAVKVLTGYSARNTPDNHALWESRTSKKQRTRDKDGASAWRVHVTKGKFAYRLHYWLKPSGVVELSTVGPHNKFEIK